MNPVLELQTTNFWWTYLSRPFLSPLLLGIIMGILCWDKTNSSPYFPLLYYWAYQKLEISQFLHPNIKFFKKSVAKIHIYKYTKSNHDFPCFFKLLVTIVFVGKSRRSRLPKILRVIEWCSRKFIRVWSSLLSLPLVIELLLHGGGSTGIRWVFVEVGVLRAYPHLSNSG
jgi:hypothetical protein